jgi:tetratricopeptide (TPR) repeat protein
MSPLARTAFAGVAALLAAMAAAQGVAAPQDPRPDVPPAVPPVAVQNPFQPFDRAAFETTCKKLGATDAQLQAFATRTGEAGLARAADDLLRQLVPAFDAAVRKHEAADPEAPIALAKVLADATEPLLRAHARYHLARLFLDSDDPERAIQILNEYLQHDINRSPLDAEAAFFYAQALADLPMPEHALPRFRAFLQWFPDASERFRSAASQRMGEIERQQESQLHDLANGMKKTERDLKKQRTGKPTQIDQETYLQELQKLIEMYQMRESQGGGAPSGNGPSSGPADSSALPEGDGSVGNLNNRPSLADRWGDMKDVDREKIAAKVNKGLPPQYQKMLEEYYKKLGKAGTRQ